MSGKLRFLPFTLTSCAVLTVLAALAGAVAKGMPGALGAAAGVALMAVLFAASKVFVVWVESVDRSKMLVGGLLAYLLKLWFVFVILSGVSGSGWAGFAPMAWGIAAGVVGWIGAYAWWLWHAKIPYVELD